MEYEVIFSAAAKKFITKIDKRYQLKILSTITELKAWPNIRNNIDIKKLVNVIDSYRIRVGIYRVVFVVFKERIVIEVLEISSRQNAYK